MKVFFSIYLLYLIKSGSMMGDITEHANWYLLDHEYCGDSVSDRIIGGDRATLGQYPWIARIGYQTYTYYENKPNFKCGGSLINDVYVLTAAHCVYNLANERISVIRLGETDERTDIDCEGDVCAPPVQDFQPAKITWHENYDEEFLKNDLALIRLNRPATITDYVNTICLPRGRLLRTSHDNEMMQIAGWGITNWKNKTTSPVLIHVRIPIINSRICEKINKKLPKISPGQICAGGQKGYDSCGGDSGGPLMKPEAIDGPPKYFLIGVISFGSLDCGSNTPAVYTRVAYYLPWILDKIEP